MRTFPLSRFRIVYDMFNDVEDAVVLALAEKARCYVNGTCQCCYDQLWMAVVAHMLVLRQQFKQNGNAPGAVTSASVGGVSVSFSAPSSTGDWGDWFRQTGPGREYLAMIRNCTAGGIYVGGLPELAAFKKVGGRRYRRGRA